MPDSFIQRISTNTRVHRVYIIPTSVGFYFSFIAFVLFLIAISYGHNLAFYCTFLFFSFVSFSAVIANESVKKIELIASEEKVQIKNGTFSPLKVTIENTSKRSQYDFRIEAQGITIGFVEELKPLEKKIVYLDMSLLDLSRGIYQLKRLTLSTRFPLGLFYSWKYRPVNNILKVEPKLLDGQLLESKGSIDDSSIIESISNRLGTDDFVETRDHRTGEGFGRIDQRRSMVLGSPQVRTYSDESGMSKCLDLRIGDIEENLSYAAFYLNNHQSSQSLSLILPNGFKTICASGVNHSQYLLELLCEFQKEKVFLN